MFCANSTDKSRKGHMTRVDARTAATLVDRSAHRTQAKEAMILGRDRAAGDDAPRDRLACFLANRCLGAAHQWQASGARSTCASTSASTSRSAIVLRGQ